MSTQEYLAAFDAWLTRWIETAHATGKDLAFRNRLINCELRVDADGAAWDHVLLDPSQRTPDGDGWTVYRLQSLWPNRVDQPPVSPAQGAGRKPAGSMHGGA